MYAFNGLYFSSELEKLLKIKNQEELQIEAAKLEDYAIASNNMFAAFRLAIELDELGISTEKIQNHIIDNGSSNFILRYATFIKEANIGKLQTAILKHHNLLQTVRFACFVNGADRSNIENLIIKANNAKCAHLFLQFIKPVDFDKIKNIIIKSRKPRYLYALAKITTDKKELDIIQDLILDSNSFMYMRLFALNIENANISKIEDKIIKSKNIDEMKKFRKVISSPRLDKLALLF